MNAHLLEQDVDNSIDIGTCSLHPEHTAFTKGIETLPFDVEQITKDAFSWFKLLSARCEDYSEVLYEVLLETAGEFFLRPVVETSADWFHRQPLAVDGRWNHSADV